ncbi:MAG: diacylglycerol kinase family protein [Bacteroidales bacterium]
MKSEKFSARSRFGSFRFASKGLLTLLKYEHNSRIHLLAALAVIAAGIVLKISMPEWCLIIIVTGLVFMAELLNTALEEMSDVIDPEWNEKIRKVKDYAAAAVLISSIVSAVVGGLIFIPKILDLL